MRAKKALLSCWSSATGEGCWRSKVSGTQCCERAWQLCEHLVNESEPHLTSVPYLCPFQGQIFSREAHLLSFTCELLCSVWARVKCEEAQTLSLSFCGVQSVSAGEEYSHLSRDQSKLCPDHGLWLQSAARSFSAWPRGPKSFKSLAQDPALLSESTALGFSTAYLHPITDPPISIRAAQKSCGGKLARRQPILLMRKPSLGIGEYLKILEMDQVLR